LWQIGISSQDDYHTTPLPLSNPLGPEDIQEGNLKLILGLIWTLIKTYQIKFTGKGISTKMAMMTWINSIIPEYKVTNFNTDWNDGRCICGVVDHIRPGACPNHLALSPANGLENCQLGMDLAERLLGIPKVMDPADLNNPSVDELSVMTYISYFCSPANQLLIDWIRKKIPERNIKNLSTDWNDGLNLGALGEACFPGICPDWEDMESTDAIKNNERLLGLMKDRLGLKCPTSAADLADPKIDELIVATYLSQFRNAKLKAAPEEFGFRVPNLPKGAALVKEPVTFEVDLSEQTANLKDEIAVSAHGPSADVKVNLKPKGPYGLEATFVPTEPGSYDVMAMFQDEHIAGSPFTLPVADPSKCSIFGDIPADMQVGKEDTLSVKARDAGLANLTCSFDDKGNLTGPIMEGEVTEQENQQYDVKLIPKQIGSTTVHFKWASVDVPRSPFNVNVCDASKASISGAEKEGRVGEPVTFKVAADEKKCGSGQLKVVPRGPSANYDPDIKKNGDGTHSITFVPWEVGPHKVSVEYGGAKVPKSPLSMNIVAAPDAKTCSAAGKGLKRAVAGETTSFQILSPESGLLSKKDPIGLQVAVLSPEKEAPSTVKDNKDGSYTVDYTAPKPGEHTITVKFYGNHIPGSPFNLDVVPSADASKCKAYGPALHPNSMHIAGNPLDLFVDTTEAGTGELQVVITGPDDSRPKVFIANEGGVYSIKWNVQQPGKYHAHIWWGDVYIPGSPFKIKVSPGPNSGMVRAYGPGLEPSMDITVDSSDFTVETKDAGIGTLTIRVHGVKGAFKIQAQPVSEAEPRTLNAFYHPQEPGDYIIAIRWSGAHVPGSPFKINIREPSKPDEEKKKIQKTKSVPPKIYLSHRGDSASNMQPDDTPEPTPLSKVDEKKKKKKNKDKKEDSQTELAVEETDGDREDQNGGSKSTSALPVKSALKNTVKDRSNSVDDNVVQEQQLEMLRKRGVMNVGMGGGIGGTSMVVGGIKQQQVQYRHVHSATSTSSTSSASGTDVREKRKKKKKF
jgi:filamin